MMKRLVLVSVSLAVTVAVAHAQVNRADVVLGYDFEKSTQPWQTLDPQAQLGLTADAENVRVGTGSLEFRYKQVPFAQGAQGMPGSLHLPTDGGLIGVKTVHFSVKSLRAMPLMVALGKQNGSSYNCAVWVPAGKWVDVDLPLSGFALDRDNGKTDPDGRLTPEQVTGVVLVDASPFLYALASSGALPVAKPTLGDQTTWIDDFDFLSTAPASAKPAHPVAEGEPIVIDTCRKTFAAWIPLGGDPVSLSEHPAEGGEPGLQMQYSTPADTLVALFHPFSLGLLQGAMRLELSAKSRVDATVQVVLEQILEPRPAQGDGKARFSQQITLKGGDDWKRLSLPLVEFKQEENQPAARFDPAMVNSIIVVDPTAIATHAKVDNVLEFDDIIAVK